MTSGCHNKYSVTKTKLEEIDNYFEYTKILGNGIYNFIEIMRNYIISYKAIIQSGRSILEEYK